MLFDIDIDVASNTNKEQFGVRALVVKNDQLVPHPCGYYIQDEGVPVDPHTGLCAVDYQTMEEKEFHKIDLLSNRVYDVFSSKEEVLEKMNQEPDWDKFLDEQYVQKLPHIKDHFDVVKEVQPRSIDGLADVVSLIRPGKIHLFEAYLENPEKTRKNLYREPPNKKPYFKKSHAYAYAYMIVAYLNKLDEQMNVIKIF